MRIQIGKNFRLIEVGEAIPANAQFFKAGLWRSFSHDSARCFVGTIVERPMLIRVPIGPQAQCPSGKSVAKCRAPSSRLNQPPLSRA